MTGRSILILGAGGEFGRIFAQLFHKEEWLVSGLDAQQTDDTAGVFTRFIRSDASAPSPEALDAAGAADWVLSCMPQQATFDAIETLGACLRPGSLFVDILSVKSPIASLMRSGRQDIEYLSIHPMFAPSVGFVRQNVAVIRVRPGKHSESFEGLLLKWGAHLHPLSAEEHDRRTAAIQVATHAAILSFGLALKAMQYDASETFPISSPPHRALLALLARIVNGNPEVYWQIQTENPMGDSARRGIISAAEQFQEIVERGDSGAFSDLLGSIRLSLGDANELLLKLAASLTSASVNAG